MGTYSEIMCCHIIPLNSTWPLLDQIQNIVSHGNYLQHQELQWPESLCCIPAASHLSLWIQSVLEEYTCLEHSSKILC